MSHDEGKFLDASFPKMIGIPIYEFKMSLEDVINLVTYLQNTYISYESPAYYIMKDMQSFIERMKDNA